MKIARVYSHLNGHEYLLVHKKSCWDEIVSAIQGVDAGQAMVKESKERQKIGELLYSPTELNKLFKQ